MDGTEPVWRRFMTAPGTTRGFMSVAETAREFGMSEMTLYRAIHAGEFPAVRIRGRIIVPVQAIAQMVAAALESGGEVDAAAWVPTDRRSPSRGLSG